MGWDIEFYVRFAEREDPGRLFARVAEALRENSAFSALSSFEVTEGDYANVPFLSLDADLHGREPPSDAGVAELLNRFSGPRTAFKGAWLTSTSVVAGSAPVSGAVTIITPGAEYEWPTLPIRPIDLVWNVGDWRRFIACADDQLERQMARQRVDAAIRNLAVVLLLGAVSIWGVDNERMIAPDHLHTVFHLDPRDYCPDAGVAAATCAPRELRAALRDVPEIVALETIAGPIIYHPELGNGDLRPLYIALGLY